MCHSIYYSTDLMISPKGESMQNPVCVPLQHSHMLTIQATEYKRFEHDKTIKPSRAFWYHNDPGI